MACVLLDPTLAHLVATLRGLMRAHHKSQVVALEEVLGEVWAPQHTGTTR